ncbi:MAG: GIY-YIG nuclease family protein [bacterium]|nr:GIY-YIG nuclease family protein [bacterium]
MFYCYILKSDINGAYYIGSCEDIANRLSQHNQRLVPATKRYIPWNLVYRQGFDILKNARRREFQIKSWKKRSAIEKLVKTFQNF